MGVAGPECVEMVLVFKETDPCKIVCQGIEPDVDYVTVMRRYVDTPAETCPAYAQVAKTAFYKTCHLIVTYFGHDKVAMSFEEVKKPVRIF